MMTISRVPNETLYNNFFTIVIVFAVLITIYSLTPLNHSSIYFVKKTI